MKSALHTWLAAASISPIVLAAGQRISGASRSSRIRNFAGSQWECPAPHLQYLFGYFIQNFIPLAVDGQSESR